MGAQESSDLCFEELSPASHILITGVIDTDVVMNWEACGLIDAQVLQRLGCETIHSIIDPLCHERLVRHKDTS